MKGHIMCTSLREDKDFEMEEIPRCPNYNEEFVKEMERLSKYWKTRKSIPLYVPNTLSELRYSKVAIRDSVAPKESFKQLEKELVKKAEGSLLEFYKNNSPEIPEEVMLAFIRVYIEFEMELIWDPKTNENVVRVHPNWKSFRDIDHDCEEYKLINEYALKEME